MAYKISYKVVTEQAETLKKVSKDMDSYITRIDQIVSKLGNDELLQAVRNDLKKFNKSLEEEKIFFNLAGQILGDVVQVYTGTDKKTVSKVDKTKAHNRDFYKRPVTVASAGASAAAVATAGATTVNVNNSYTTAGNSTTATPASTVVYEEHNTTNVYVTEAGEGTISDSLSTSEIPSDVTPEFVSATAPISDTGMGIGPNGGVGAETSSVGANIAALGAGGVLTAGGIVAASAIAEAKKEKKDTPCEG